MSDSPSSTFAEVLRAGRDGINARFAMMRREFPDLRAETWFAFLRGPGDAVVTAVESVEPAAVMETGRAVCEVGIELVARNFAGPRARHGWVDEAWRRVLTAAASVVAAEPRRVIGALSNAVVQLAATPGARPAQWIDLMVRVAPLTGGDVSTLLRAGQVAAWRSGMAHYREGALAAAEQLDPPLMLATLGTQGDAADPLGLLRDDAWYDPDREGSSTGPVARSGGFRGYGGPFLVPPIIASLDGHWIASSGNDHWLLVADAFGATFHRLTDEEIPAPSVPKSARNLDVPPDCGVVTSAARVGSAIAVTTSLTHEILFFHVAA